MGTDVVKRAFPWRFRPGPPRDARGRFIGLRAIHGLLATIIERCHPEQVWLFGSRARGDARLGSDWDLLVVVSDDSDERMFDPRFAWQLKDRSGVRADVVLCRSADFREARDTVNTLAFEAAHAGVLIHER